MSKELLNIAKQIKLPDWATHVAVQKYSNEAEPCMWFEEARDYIDEDINNLSVDSWAGSYKHAYWEFFSKKEIDDE